MRKLVAWLVDHPRLVLALAAAITIGFATAIPRLTTVTDFKEYISKDDPAIVALNRAEDRYGSGTFFMVAIEAEETIFNSSTLEKIKALGNEFEALIGVDEVTSPLNAQVIAGTEAALVVGPAAPRKEVPQTPEALEEYKQRVLGSRMAFRSSTLRSRTRSGGSFPTSAARRSPGPASAKELASPRVVASGFIPDVEVWAW